MQLYQNVMYTVFKISALGPHRDDAIYDPRSGAMVAYIMRGGSLGILTAHFFDTTTPTIRLLCRCYKTQLLPSMAWLFPPRCAQFIPTSLTSPS